MMVYMLCPSCCFPDSGGRAFVYGRDGFLEIVGAFVTALVSGVLLVARCRLSVLE
jgi:hypothetical protein